MDEYFAAKRVLFEGCGTDPPRAAVTNLDDEYGAKLADFSRKRSSVVLTYGWDRGDFHAEKADIAPRGTRFDLVTPQGEDRNLFSADRTGERVQHSGCSGGVLRARLLMRRRSPAASLR